MGAKQATRLCCCLPAGHGVEGLREFLVSKAAPGDWELEDGLATDRPEADQAKELVREQLFKRFYKGAARQAQLSPANLERAAASC